MRGAIAKIARCRRFQLLASVPQPPESNREPLGLESHLTPRKERTGHRSNREKTRGLQVRNSARGSMRLGLVGEGRGGPPAPPGLGGPYISRRFCALSLGPNHAPGAWWGAPGKRRSREGYPGPPLQRKRHLRILFRLEPTPTLCFHQLTENLNEPLFRLEKEVPRIPAPKNTRASR